MSYKLYLKNLENPYTDMYNVASKYMHRLMKEVENVISKDRSYKLQILFKLNKLETKSPLNYRPL